MNIKPWPRAPLSVKCCSQPHPKHLPASYYRATNIYLPTYLHTIHTSYNSLLMSSAPSTPFELKGLNPDSTATTPTLESKGSSPDPPAPPAQPILPNSTKKSRRQLPFQGSGTPFTVHPDPTPDAHRGERQRVQVNPVGIMEAVFSHKSTTWDSITVTDLVNFDDMEAYSVKAEICERLWKIEVNRLADAVNNPEKELRFRDPEHLGQSSQEGYMELSALANQLSGALMIIEIDNQMISLRHFKSLHDESKMQRALFHLQKYFGVDKNPSSETIRTQNHTESSQRALDLLINYLTAMVARLLTQSVDGDYWQHNLIAVLAKWATKTKLLSGNLSKSADICMEGAEYEAQQISDEEAFKMNPLSKLSTLARLVERGAEGAAGILIGNLKTPEEVVRGNYHQHQISYRQGIGALLEYIIQSLKHRDYDSGLSMTSYEVCTAIYETGFEGYKVSYP